MFSCHSRSPQPHPQRTWSLSPLAGTPIDRSTGGRFLVHGAVVAQRTPFFAEGDGLHVLPFRIGTSVSSVSCFLFGLEYYPGRLPYLFVVSVATECGPMSCVFRFPLSSVQAIVIGETCAFAWRRHRSRGLFCARARGCSFRDLLLRPLLRVHNSCKEPLGARVCFSMNRPARLARGMFRFQLHPPSIFPWTTPCFMLVLESSWGPSGWRFLGLSFVNLKVCVRFAGTCFACFCGTSALMRQLCSCC